MESAEEAQKLAEKGERLGLEEDDEVVRNLTNPRLPSEEEVEKHDLMGHIPSL